MTNNHNYNTPEKGSTDWHAPLNENFEQIDTDIEIRDAASNLENYSPKSGAKFLAIDTGMQYIGDGSSWQPLPIRDDLVRRIEELESKVASLEDESEDGSGDETSSSEPSADLVVEFDDESYIDHFDDNYLTDYQFLTDEYTNGRKGLCIDIDQGNHYGTSMKHHLSVNHGSMADELHTRWWMYIPEDFEIEHQCKLHTIGHLDEHGWGGRTSDGTGGWSSLVSLHPYHSSGLGLEFYTYHADMSDWGDHERWDVAMPKGEWVQLDFYAKVNTPGEYDGEIRGWINGEPGHEVTGLKFRESGYDQYAIDLFWFNIYHGGSDPSPANNSLVFKDLELWCDKQVMS